VLTAKNILLSLLGIVAVGFLGFWIAHLLKRGEVAVRILYLGFVGFVTDFFDTLGVGSFATTTSLFRARRVVDDEHLPGTLNVGHTIPTIVQALIYIKAIDVEIVTLISLIGASVVGAWAGAQIVSRLPRRGIQLGMGFALLAAVGVMIYRLVSDIPDGTATELRGGLLAAAIAANIVIGALMTIGIGAYAPIMILVSLLGMNADTAFPIMMGSCAFLMPVASVRFIRAKKYDPLAAMGLTVAGVPAVLIAALLVVNLPLEYVKWLVVLVVIYTASMMLWSGITSKAPAEAGGRFQ
jgi:uncharacterized membrane protein YfcA